MEYKMDYPPHFARCSVGSGKWFWVTARSQADYFENRFIAMGIAASATEAEAEARASIAKALGEVSPEQWSGQMARSVYHLERTRKAATNSSNAAGVEYLYKDELSDYDGHRESTPHRIVKKTAKRVYVEYRVHTWTENGQTYQGVETLVLDRQELETTGRCGGGSGRHSTRRHTMQGEKPMALDALTFWAWRLKPPRKP